ncbi:MAG: PTS glucose transporter subunit IIA [Abditibacteriota bacterium]|nr:PTS glucose transporter subunit IIA [Abditibacteriota bacterium]
MNFFSRLTGKKNVVRVQAPCRGTYMPMEQIPDQVFSQGILGPCCGIQPQEGEVCAPVSGKIIDVADTLHAFCIESEGAELLVHLGIDTVALKGECFTLLAEKDSVVRAGDPVMRMDIAAVRAAGLDPVIILAVTNPDDLGEIRFSRDPECIIEINKEK